jgi:hypothetical protein
VGVALGVSLISISAILQSGSQSTSGNVGSVIIESIIVENAGVAIGISLISHSIPEIQSTSSFRPPS